jgi:hypothetical protein
VLPVVGKKAFSNTGNKEQRNKQRKEISTVHDKQSREKNKAKKVREKDTEKAGRK